MKVWQMGAIIGAGTLVGMFPPLFIVFIILGGVLLVRRRLS